MTDTARFGPLLLPPDEQTQHFAAVGSTGSGKTTLLRLLMQDVVPNIASGTDQRALIYDAKQDVMSMLKGISPDTVVLTMNPFDERGVAWDIARDVTDPAVAIEMACTLIPEMSESQPFFADAARHLTYGVMLSFMQRGLPWTLADLLRALASPSLLLSLIHISEPTRHDSGSRIPSYA